MKTEEMTTMMETSQEEIIEENSKVPADKGNKGSRKPKTGKAANSRFVYVRKGPSASAQVIANMNLGETATILERLPGYYKIQTEKGGYVGYVSSNYFEED